MTERTLHGDDWYTSYKAFMRRNKGLLKPTSNCGDSSDLGGDGIVGELR